MREIIFITFFVIASIGNLSLAQKVPYHIVEPRPNAQSDQWKNYKTITVDLLPGFKIGKDPKQSRYGGWQAKQYKATGFFRAQKIDGRWWIIDPKGYLFIHRGGSCFQP